MILNLKTMRKAYVEAKNQIMPYKITRGFTKNLVMHYSSVYPLVGVEVGVQQGFNAFNILNRLNVETLYLVDLSLADARSFLVKYEDCVMFLEGKSEFMIEELACNLDFGYIDASHVKCFVEKDIGILWTKIKPNGVMGGHDFDLSHRGVVDAVLEFKDKNNLILYGDEKDWWFYKPGIEVV